MNDLTLVRFSGHEGIADVATLEGSFGSIKPQLALAVVLVGSVTGETVVRENRPDIPIEIDLSKKPTCPQDNGDQLEDCLLYTSDAADE